MKVLHLEHFHSGTECNVMSCRCFHGDNDSDIMSWRLFNLMTLKAMCCIGDGAKSKVLAVSTDRHGFDIYEGLPIRVHVKTFSSSMFPANAERCQAALMEELNSARDCFDCYCETARLCSSGIRGRLLSDVYGRACAAAGQT